MKVLHLAPLWFPIAHDSPGGIETFMTTLIPALEQLGCENTLLASGDSQASGGLTAVVDVNLVDGMIAGTVWEPHPYEHHQLTQAIELAPEFDLIHSHIGRGAYALCGVAGVSERVVHTYQNPITPDDEWFVERHPEIVATTLNGIQAEKLRARGATRVHVIPNAIDLDHYRFRGETGEGLVFLGRMEPDKGPDIAVRVARELGLGLTLAGPIVDKPFFTQEILPSLDEQIAYVGVADHARKVELFGRAACALVPSRWDEPFGLVAIEAMACGTPVVALANGGLPGLVESGVSGYVTEDEAELPALVRRAMQLNRQQVRQSLSPRFEILTIAARYLDIYTEILHSARPR